MAVNNKPAVVAIVRQKGLAHPAKILAVLLIKRPQGIYTGMDKQTSAIVMPIEERVKPSNMMRRQVGGRLYAITTKSFIAAVTKPDFVLSSIMRGQRKFFMIASEADCQIGLLGLQIDQKFDDATTVGAAINIVSKKNKLGGLFFSVSVQLTSFYQVLQLVQAAMDVADGVSPLHGTPMV